MGGFLTFRDLSHPAWSSGEVVSTLTDSAKLFIFVYAPHRQTLAGWSANSREVLGVRDFEIARDGNIFLRHAHIDDRYQLLNSLERRFESRQPVRLIYRWLRPDTEQLRWILCRAEPVVRDGMQLYEGVLFDISAELEMLGGAAHSGGELCEALGAAVLIIDGDDRIIARHCPLNLAELDFAGSGRSLKELPIGRVLHDCFAESNDWTRLKRLYEQALSGDSESYRLKWRNRTIEVSARKIGAFSGSRRVAIIVGDVTERLSLEEENAKLNRMESYARLTSGVFHNINNSLQAVAGYAAAIRSQAGTTNAIRAACDNILGTVERAAELSHQALAFEDSLLESETALDLNVALMSALNRIQDLLSTGFKIGVSIGTVPPVRANFHRLVETLEALFRSCQSIFREAPGFSIQTGSAEPPAGDERSAEGYCKLTIAALVSPARAAVAGRSISAMNRPIQPLDTISALLGQWGITLKSERANSGNETVTLLFPAIASGPASVDVKPAAAVEVSPLILVVDDDRQVLQTIQQLLNEAGLPCATADGRKEAVAIFKRHRAALRVVLLDELLNPGHGSALLKQLRRISPDIAAIGFSGGSPPDLKALKEAGAIEVLRKPVNPAKLLQTLRGVLSRQKAA